MKTKELKAQAEKLINDFPALKEFGFYYDNDGITLNWPVYFNIRFDDKFKIKEGSGGYLEIENDRLYVTFHCRKGEYTFNDRLTKIHITVFR